MQNVCPKLLTYVFLTDNSFSYALVVYLIFENITVRPRFRCRFYLIITNFFYIQSQIITVRPPNMEVQDADNSSQAIKRRLPLEIKQRLAKVARLAV